MCGLTLFMMVLQVMKPQMVIYYRSKEMGMEYLTIESCYNNVRTHLTKMQEMLNDIDSLQKYGIKYDGQRFLTITFNKMGKKFWDLLADVKRQRSGWAKKPPTFNISTFIADMIKLYTNYKSPGERDKQGADHNKVLVAL